MSWVIDQVKIAGDYSGTAGTTGSITLTSVGAGHNLAVFIQNGNTNAYTFSDNIGGNTYVNVDAVFNANNQQLASFYVLNASGGITSITITDTTANELIFWSLAVIEFHWSGGGTPTAHGHNSATGTGTALSSGAAAFTSGDLTVGAACTGGAGSNIVAGSGFTQQNNSTTFEYSDETGTTSGTATFTIAASDNWACEALTFTPPASSTVFSDSGGSFEAGLSAARDQATPIDQSLTVRSDSDGTFEPSLTARSGNERRRTIWT